SSCCAPDRCLHGRKGRDGDRDVKPRAAMISRGEAHVAAERGHALADPEQAHAWRAHEIAGCAISATVRTIRSGEGPWPRLFCAANCRRTRVAAECLAQLVSASCAMR